MKSQKKALLFGVLTLLWTGVIFSFSLQPAKESASLSGGLLKCLLDWLDWLTGLQIPVSFAHFLIRKIAHFGEFFLLGIFSFQASKYLWQKRFPALIYGIVIAVCDEGIQYFTGGGRAMRVTDMLLDTFGVAAAVLLLVWFHRLSIRRKYKHTES